jgi:arsenite methyltransferase
MAGPDAIAVKNTGSTTMTDYLSYQFNDTLEFMETFDEAPLWSASFGLLLLKHLELRRGMTVIDIGSGAGFPLMELASRLGNSCRVYGLDPWVNANKRSRLKIANYGLHNVAILECSAEKIPLADNSTDLIVSNLGINNFENPGTVFLECNRVLRPEGRLVLTTNLDGHWKEFYRIFEDTLNQTGRQDLVPRLQEQQRHRGTIGSISDLFTDNGFKVSRVFEETLDMKFLDGTTFLNHYFVKLGWLGSWKELAHAEDLESIFRPLENNLDAYAAASGGLNLTVPMAYMEGIKI